MLLSSVKDGGKLRCTKTLVLTLDDGLDLFALEKTLVNGLLNQRAVRVGHQCRESIGLSDEAESRGGDGEGLHTGVDEELKVEDVIEQG